VKLEIPDHKKAFVEDGMTDLILAELLKDFGSGKLSRRQLMKSLALGVVATAASSAIAAPAEAAEEKGFKATAVNHISYNVPDYAKSRDFYMDLLGMRLTFDDGTQCALEFGSLKAPDSIYIRKVKQPGDKASVDHLALSVANFKAAEAEALLKRHGQTHMYDGDTAWFAWDPDGYVFQVCAEKGVYPGSGVHNFDPSSGIAGAAKVNAARAKGVPGFKATAVNHISYNVADYAKSRDFFMDLFGMKLTYDDGKGCALEFGNPKSPDSLYIRNVKPGQKANVDHLAFSVANFNLKGAEAQLKNHGLEPKFDGDAAWTVHDPDGYTFQVCAEKGVYPYAALPGFTPAPGLAGAVKINAARRKSK
jgi:catechol 2,3-dioxygenase-like lactoylglutathione lyase family enzyme